MSPFISASTVNTQDFFLCFLIYHRSTFYFRSHKENVNSIPELFTIERQKLKVKLEIFSTTVLRNQISMTQSVMENTVCNNSVSNLKP